MATKKAAANVVPVTQVEQEVAEQDTGVVTLVEPAGKRDIFLPLVHDKKGLSLISLQTWGRPLRYFSDPADQLLNYLWQSTSGGRCPTTVSTAGVVRISEEFSWNVSYVVKKLENDYHFRQGSGSPLQRTLLTSLNDVFNTDMPAEMRLALQQVITTELSETERA